MTYPPVSAPGQDTVDPFLSVVRGTGGDGDGGQPTGTRSRAEARRLREPVHGRQPLYGGPAPRTALIFAGLAVAFSVLLGTLISTQIGALGIAFTLLVAGGWRALTPAGNQPGGIAVRSKTLDVLLYFGLAATITALAFAAPPPGY